MLLPCSLSRPVTEAARNRRSTQQTLLAAHGHSHSRIVSQDQGLDLGHGLDLGLRVLGLSLRSARVRCISWLPAFGLFVSGTMASPPMPGAFPPMPPPPLPTSQGDLFRPRESWTQRRTGPPSEDIWMDCVRCVLWLNLLILCYIIHRVLLGIRTCIPGP